MTHILTEVHVYIHIFQHALREPTEQSVHKTARVPHSTRSRATAPQGRVSAKQDGEARRAVMMLMSVARHLDHLQCVLITQYVTILLAVSSVSALKDFTKLRTSA